MAIEGVPALDMLVFWSGDVAFLMRSVPITRGGIEYVRLYMILTPQVVWRYHLNENDVSAGGDVDYSITEYGCFIREYPAAALKWLSHTPENRVALLTCNFDGTSVFNDELVKYQNKILKSNEDMRILESECSRLREQLKSTIGRLRTLQSQTNQK